MSAEAKAERRWSACPLAAATHNCRDRPRSNRGNHGPIVGAPVAPHIAACVPAESATPTAGAVTVTTIAAAAGECAGGKPRTSENKNNSKNNYGVAQH